MARLIDADAAMLEYHKLMDQLIKSTTKPDIDREALSLLAGTSVISKAPTVDAAPVVHAKWEMDYSWHGHCRCSNCHGTSIEAEWLNRYMWPYCPNCGAQMNRGKDDG